MSLEIGTEKKEIVMHCIALLEIELDISCNLIQERPSDNAFLKVIKPFYITFIGMKNL